MGKPVTGWSSKHVFHAILLRAALQGLATFLVRTVIAAVATVFRAYPNHDARSLTPARMTRLLAAGGALTSPDTVVTGTRWTDVELGGVGTVRRLHLTYNRADATAPASVIVKALGVSYKVR